MIQTQQEREKTESSPGSSYTGLLIFMIGPIWIMCIVVNQSLWPVTFGSLARPGSHAPFLEAGGAHSHLPRSLGLWVGVERSSKMILGPIRRRMGRRCWAEGYKNDKDPPKPIYFISFNSLQSVRGPVQHSLFLPLAESWTCQVNIGT